MVGRLHYHMCTTFGAIGQATSRQSVTGIIGQRGPFSKRVENHGILLGQVVAIAEPPGIISRCQIETCQIETCQKMTGQKMTGQKMTGLVIQNQKYTRRGSNSQPSVPKTDALSS